MPVNYEWRGSSAPDDKSGVATFPTSIEAGISTGWPTVSIRLDSLSDCANVQRLIDDAYNEGHRAGISDCKRALEKVTP